MSEIIFYTTPQGTQKISVTFDKETAWLSLNQMAELFGVDKSGISRHLRNIFKTGELHKNAVVAKNATTAIDGKTYQVEFYSLDAIFTSLILRYLYLRASVSVGRGRRSLFT